MSDLSSYSRLLLEYQISNYTPSSCIFTGDNNELLNISTEDRNNSSWLNSVYNFIAKIIRWIKDKAIDLYKFLSSKLFVLFKDKKMKYNLRRISRLGRLNYISNEELSNIINDFILLEKRADMESVEDNGVMGYLNDNKMFIPSEVNQFIKTHSVKNHRYLYFFDDHGGVKDIDEVIKRTEQILREIDYNDIDTFVNKKGYGFMISKDISPLDLKWMDFVYIFIADILNVQSTLDGPGTNSTTRKPPSNVNSFVTMVEQFEDKYKFVDKSMSKITESIKKEVDFVYKELNNNKNNDEIYQELLRKVDKLQLKLILSTVPVTYLANFSRLIGYVSKSFFSEPYVTTNILPIKGELYHISNDPNLGRQSSDFGLDERLLAPRVPMSGGFEFLPPRVSFALTPLKACYGTPKYFVLQPDQVGSKIQTRVLYLYRGIPNNRTRYIKQELLRASINPAEYQLSEEIAVTTNIDIEFVSKIKVTYDISKKDYDPRKIIKVEYVD